MRQCRAARRAGRTAETTPASTPETKAARLSRRGIARGRPTQRRSSDLLAAGRDMRAGRAMDGKVMAADESSQSSHPDHAASSSTQYT